MKRTILFILSIVFFDALFQIKGVFAMEAMTTFEETYEVIKTLRQRRPASQPLWELNSVVYLRPGADRWLSSDPVRIQCFLEAAPDFKRLCSLDLTRQRIDDSFIERIAAKGFERINNINLRGNPQITSLSLKYILDSDSLGSLRELPQISSRYGGPSSEIEINVEGTSITSDVVAYYNDHPRSDFSIQYRRAADDVQLSRSVTDSIKWLRVNT